MLTGIHIHRESEIGPGLVIHNFCCILILAKRIGHSCTVNQGVSVANIRGHRSSDDRKQCLFRCRM